MNAYYAGYIARCWLVPRWANPVPFLLARERQNWDAGYDRAGADLTPKRKPLLRLVMD